MTDTTLTRETAERISHDHPELHVEITANGALFATMTPVKSLHGRYAPMIAGWLAGEFGWPRVSSETGVLVGGADNPHSYRSPDVMLFKSEPPNIAYHEPSTVDLAVEVLSPASSKADREEKPVEYARVGIVNFWLVDPERALINFFVLRDGELQRLAAAPIEATIANTRPSSWLEGIK